MNLVIDIGNSYAKLGVYHGDEKVFVTRTQDLSKDFIAEIVSNYRIKRILYSTVDAASRNYIDTFSFVGIESNSLSHDTTLPFKMEYLTPGTLGTDRIAAVAGAHNMFAGCNVLVIDAGTAITFDLLTAEGKYPGGNISPGLSMRFKALHSFTGKLPLVSPENKYDMLGRDTQGAIRSGVQQGLLFEINEYIRNLKKMYKDLEVIITGGDGKMLKEMLGDTVVYNPDLVIEGLNYIINRNAQTT